LKDSENRVTDNGFKREKKRKKTHFPEEHLLNLILRFDAFLRKERTNKQTNKRTNEQTNELTNKRKLLSGEK
jgi:hypothetical protein